MSNRFVTMPSSRNRSIGVQLYKAKVEGFLHWGYNYYNNWSSGDAINPYMDLSMTNTLSYYIVRKKRCQAFLEAILIFLKKVV